MVFPPQLVDRERFLTGDEGLHQVHPPVERGPLQQLNDAGTLIGA